MWHAKPLSSILLLALAVRLLAVFFAPGFFWHDDHFLTVEPAASWAMGHNFNDWLPGIGNERTSPEPISFFYLSFLFLFFKMFQFIGIENPETQMYVMRLIHACYSLLIVYYGYKITEKISSKQNAIEVGVLLTFIAVLPNFSVRNLVEMVCVPPLMAGIFLLVGRQWSAGSGHPDSYQEKVGTIPKVVTSSKRPTLQRGISPYRHIFFSALLMGLAVGIRYQTVLIVAGVGLVLLIQKQFRAAVLFGVVSFVAFFITQMDDVLWWGGQPFQHLLGYFGYNTANASGYPGSPFAYFSFIGYFILPPVSLFLAFGFFRRWKKELLIFLPVFLFLLFHFIYPNRQERFILPALPFVVMLGVIGWNEFVFGSKFWLHRKKLLSGCWKFFWVMNTVVMLVFCFTSGKKARVEAVSYLYDQGDCKNFIQEFSHKEGASQVPQFYSGAWPSYYIFRNSTDVESVVAAMPRNEEVRRNMLHNMPVPNYILFYDDEKLDERVARLKTLFPSLTFKTTIMAGWFDKMLHRLNDKNQVERVHVYKME